MTCPLLYNNYDVTFYDYFSVVIIVVEIQKEPRNFVERQVISQCSICPLIYHPPDSGNFCGSHRNFRTFRHFEFFVKQLDWDPWLPRLLRPLDFDLLMVLVTSEVFEVKFENADLGRRQRPNEMSMNHSLILKILLSARRLRGMSSTLTKNICRN